MTTRRKALYTYVPQRQLRTRTKANAGGRRRGQRGDVRASCRVRRRAPGDAWAPQERLPAQQRTRLGGQIEELDGRKPGRCACGFYQTSAKCNPMHFEPRARCNCVFWSTHQHIAKGEMKHGLVFEIPDREHGGGVGLGHACASGVARKGMLVTRAGGQRVKKVVV